MNLRNFLNPTSIAIIGASRDKTKIGYQLFNNVRTGGFKGKIFPINLKAEAIDGVKAYRDIQDISEKIDLAAIVIPAKFVFTEVEKCAKRGIKNFVIISAGFSEVGKEGEEMEEEIHTLAQKFNLNILGPNCLGFVNSNSNLNLTFARTPADSALGKATKKIAFLSQSGAIGSAALDWFSDKNVGLSYFFSLGNEVNLDGNDFFDFFAKDKNTDLVVAYCEEIKNGKRFMEAVSRLSRVKPVAILKSGKTKAGQLAAMSHTGSMAGSQAAIQTGLQRSGVIILENLADIFNLCQLTLRRASVENNEIYIVSNAGGPLVLTTDELEKNNLPLGQFSSRLLKELKTKLFDVPTIKNPLDIIGDATPERYQIALENILAEKKIDNVLVLLTQQTTTEVEKTAEEICRLGKKYPEKMLCVSFIGGVSLLKAKEILKKNSIPSFDYPEEALRAMGMMIKYQMRRKTIKPYEMTGDSKKTIVNSKQFNYLESFDLLKKYGIKTVETKVVKSEKELAVLKYPVVLKVVGEKIIHKTDENLLAINLKKLDDAKKAFAQFKGVLKNEENFCVAQPMIKGGLEVIIGFKRDESFGPIIMVGAGGIYAEVLNDIQLEVEDVDLPRALAMIQKLKIAKILDGARGKEKLDSKTLAETIVKVAKLARENSEIQEFDINPLFVNEKGVSAVDVRIIT